MKSYIRTLDHGWQLGIGIDNGKTRKAIFINLPVPLSLKTIKYSIKHQGLMNSILNKFYVPDENKKA